MPPASGNPLYLNPPRRWPYAREDVTMADSSVPGWLSGDIPVRPCFPVPNSPGMAISGYFGGFWRMLIRIRYISPPRDRLRSPEFRFPLPVPLLTALWQTGMGNGSCRLPSLRIPAKIINPRCRDHISGISGSSSEDGCRPTWNDPVKRNRRYFPELP